MVVKKKSKKKNDLGSGIWGDFKRFVTHPLGIAILLVFFFLFVINNSPGGFSDLGRENFITGSINKMIAGTVFTIVGYFLLLYGIKLLFSPLFKVGIVLVIVSLFMIGGGVTGVVSFVSNNILLIVGGAVALFLFKNMVQKRRSPSPSPHVARRSSSTHHHYYFNKGNNRGK